MLEEAWKLYRGWAARARHQQARTTLWNQIALGAVVLTAFLGTLAGQVEEGSTIVIIITGISAVVTAISGWLGREALAVDSETKWVKARGFAEAIKSECFRFAGGVGDYAGGGDKAETAFSDRVIALRAEIRDLGLAPGDPTPPAGGSEPPPAGMTKEWYLEKRVGEQRAYFVKTVTRSDRKIFWYRVVALGSMVLAALCSVAAGIAPKWPIAAWTGVITTISAAFIAAGMNERAKAIGAAAAGMINQIDDILLQKTRLSLDALVARTEDALHVENMQWRETMQKTRDAAVAAAAQQQADAAPAPADEASDAPEDSPVEAPMDTPEDGPVDAPADAPVDAPVDAPEDSPVDVPPEDEPPTEDAPGTPGT